MEKWEKTYPDNRIHRHVICDEYKIDDQHNVLIMRHDKVFDSYIMWHDDKGHTTPFLYMFGTPVGSMPYFKIVEMTCVVAPDYYRLFDEEE